MSYSNKRVFRKSFGRLDEIVDIPNLVAVQKASYDSFVFSKNPYFGLQAIFQDVFPVHDFSGRCQVEFIKYTLEEPRYDVHECRQRGLTYASALRASMRFVIWDIDHDTESRSIRDIKEQDVYMGDLPRMTDNGTFIINGTERVVVSQMHRSPGVFFDHDGGRGSTSGQLLHSARIIPYRGSWVDFEFDAKGILHVRIDKRRKIPVTTLLLVLDGTENGDTVSKENTPTSLLQSFYDSVILRKKDHKWILDLSPVWIGHFFDFDLVNMEGVVLLSSGQRINKKHIERWGEQSIIFPDSFVHNQYVAEDIIDQETGEPILLAGDVVGSAPESWLDLVEELRVLHTQPKYGWILRNTLAVDKCRTRSDALLEIYRMLRPGEPATLDVAERTFKGLLFDIERYDLSDVGRVKMNERLGFNNKDVPDTVRTLRQEDIFAIVKYMLLLRNGEGEVDDIDHLGNRRVRSVGELMDNQLRLGMLRVERAVRERMGSIDLETAMPHDLVNAKPLVAVLREFFGSSQLSQFMDQTNPLSEVTHKRRLSAFGPGGLTRDRAGFEVRDVHLTHYGRICPIETPEGPNIGLINSLATYARVNSYGFIETPYRKVKDGRVFDEYVYMAALEEGNHVIAEANATLDSDGRFLQEMVSCRSGGDYIVASPKDISFMDVSPKQLVSVATSLIPFLENDDANRALMGANMQRQAVPLLKTEAPLVGTGMEERVAHDAGVAVYARRKGIVHQVDGSRVVVHVLDFESHESGIDIYNLMKFQRSNQNTCISQKPLVNVGDVVEIGDIIADGPSMEKGELALGRNMLVAFMPWHGYNYEDSILISERVVRDDIFTSIHIEEFELMVRDTKLGQEEITRDIPNLSDEALKNLDESGIVYVGAEVKAGDILVGKVTPKGESPVTPEEKLLRAVFGEKAADVRDTSLRLPPGNIGTVVEVRVFSRRGLDKDERSIALEESEIESLERDREAERAVLERSFRQHFFSITEGQSVNGKDINAKTMSKNLMDSLTTAQLRYIAIDDKVLNERLDGLKKQFQLSIKELESRFADKVEKIQLGGGLLPGVMKMIKVFVAVKRKLQPGDKMAGRHGNKGVVSKIVPIEDMPYLEDGTHVDVVLNPLGVPSRMNVGQILETHLGWAAHGLGRQVSKAYDLYCQNNFSLDELRQKLSEIYDDDVITQKINNMDREALENLAFHARRGIPFATPVFDGASEHDINVALQRAGLSITGQERLIDGRTGEFFERPVTVGYMYILKLHHLADEKIHARSIGPYSLVTQQPLGGKAQFGGQRFGEMEVWALEAYGAAHVLQEMLTVKSDDVIGRAKVYESIVRGDNQFITGIPESFNVLVKELKSLGLNIELQKDTLGIDNNE